MAHIARAARAYVRWLDSPAGQMTATAVVAGAVAFTLAHTYPGHVAWAWWARGAGNIGSWLAYGWHAATGHVSATWHSGRPSRLV